MRALIIFIFLFLSSLSWAQEDGLTIVNVGPAQLQTEKIWVQMFDQNDSIKSADSKIIEEFLDIVSNDLMFYRKYFNVVKGFEKKHQSFRPSWQKPNFKSMASLSVNYLIQSKWEKSDNGIRGTILLHNTQNEKLMLQTAISELTASTVRRKAHELSDSIYQAITDKPSIFLSQLFFVCESKTRKGIKELYRMDFDGRNVEPLTSHRRVVISPSPNQDGSKVVYSLITQNAKKIQNVDLYLLDVKTKKSEPISTKKGINSGAIFGSNDQSVYLTLSYEGNAEIYEMNLENKSLRNVTKHFAEDVDPSLNASGTLITFLSSRPGKAMIYTLDPRGVERDVKRISFVGRFNATPRFSPDGKEIAFSSWVDERFDIYRIGSDGNGLVRLTKDFGSNESPTYSPDGEFIAFSSQRILSRSRAVQDIYIMDREGEILGPVTKDMGNCTSPRWSK